MIRKLSSLWLVLQCLGFWSIGQNVGIGGAPNASAMLDVQSTSSGLLVPRMTSAQRTAISNPAQGLLVYDTEEKSFYYFQGQWQVIGATGWNLDGNGGITASQFLGTLDASPLQLRTNNLERLLIDGNGNIQVPTDQQTLRFAATNTTPNQPMMMMFSSGTRNRDRMVLSHSPSFPNWGLEYRDTSDIFYMRNSSGRNIAFDLAGGQVGIGTEFPEFPLDVTGRMRLRSGGNLSNSAGIWFANQANTFNRAFLGMESADSTLGIYSQHLGQWAVQFELMREPRMGIGYLNNTIDGVVRAELHVVHTNFGGSNDGVRIQNEGVNQHYWNLYTSNSTGALEFYKQGIKRATIDPASGAFTAVSDRRVKRNISPMPDHVLPGILQLRPSRYQYASFSDNEGHTISSNRFHYGFIAQEVETLFPELVFRGSDNPDQDFMTMNYAGFGVLAIKAVQEQQQEIEGLKAEIALLKQLVQKLATKN